jgi:CheY-like chemotaxis protein
MDIRLPVMDGMEATRAIKRAKPAQPVVMETAYAFPDDRERAFHAGCDDYLVKPISVEYLQKILRQYILP